MVINFDEMPKSDDKIETIELFKLNGVSYEVPTKVRANVGLKYAHLARTQGAEYAADYLLEQLVGKEAYAALLDYDELTEGMITQIYEAVSKIVSGDVKTPKGSKK